MSNPNIWKELRQQCRLPEPRLISEKFPEWVTLEKVAEEFQHFGKIEILEKSTHEGHEFPLVSFSCGSTAPDAPVLGLFGGVHGLERIGSQVVLSLMQSFVEMQLWDELTREMLKKVRLVFFPIVNPWGILLKNRSNPQGVDLMRNAPVEAMDKTHFLLGGQRYSNKLPWYRGAIPEKMEIESQALVDFCKKNFFQSPAVITMDFHSGFGVQDQLWFPYAKTTKPFPHLAQTTALTEMFGRTLPNHIYKIEPQAQNYTTHGDLWDYLYDLYRETNSGTYLPLCLEMGSWLWIRKNPMNAFSVLGPFNPIQPHRQKRILRRHLPLFDFLMRSTFNHSFWSHLPPEQVSKYESLALEKWYLKI